MKILQQNQLIALEGGNCRLWLGPDDNSGDNNNADPLPFSYCNTCLFLAAISQNPTIDACPL